MPTVLKAGIVLVGTLGYLVQSCPPWGLCPPLSPTHHRTQNTREEGIATQHQPSLLFQTPGSWERQEGFVQAPEERRPEKAGVPCQLLCFTPKECRGREGNTAPPLPAPLGTQPGCRVLRLGGRGGMKDGEAGVARILWYHHVQPGLGAGGLGRGEHAMTHTQGDMVMPSTALVGANNSEQELPSKYHTPLWKERRSPHQRKGGVPTKSGESSDTREEDGEK